ncbi:MAG TPA: hypothetical protein DCQ64_11020 [Candidatus Rokubacteria bacterium]|nr:hypothetical protein [Candidatus Rokubacteria bacterium]
MMFTDEFRATIQRARREYLLMAVEMDKLVARLTDLAEAWAGQVGQRQKPKRRRRTKGDR